MNNVHQLKLEICDIGRRIYNKGFAAGNDGNISFRLGPNEVLCTPTMVCKGFLKPEDLCTCDMEGKQLSGKRKRTSEVLLHLAIMKERPDVKSCVHCHPPHATAFAVAREPIHIGRAEFRLPVATDVAIAKIVRQDEDDVGFGWLVRHGLRAPRQDGGKNGQQFYQIDSSFHTV